MNAIEQITIVAHISIGILIGWCITSIYHEYKQGNTIFNKKPTKPKGGFIK